MLWAAKTHSCILYYILFVLYFIHVLLSRMFSLSLIFFFVLLFLPFKCRVFLHSHSLFYFLCFTFLLFFHSSLFVCSFSFFRQYCISRSLFIILFLSFFDLLPDSSFGFGRCYFLKQNIGLYSTICRRLCWKLVQKSPEVRRTYVRHITLIKIIK